MRVTKLTPTAVNYYWLPAAVVGSSYIFGKRKSQPKSTERGCFLYV